MIRDVVVHLNNEQPVLVDVFDVPKARDQGLVCTNMRTLDGKRPIFIDREDSVFFFPYTHIRFIEIHAGSLEGGTIEAAGGDIGAVVRPPRPASTPATAAPATEPAPGTTPTEDEGDLELDEDFLRRIREA